MKYFAEIVTFVLLGYVGAILICLLLGKDVPDSQMLNVIVGFALREVAQAINNFQNRRERQGDKE